MWPEDPPAGLPALTGTEGELVSVSIAVEPRLLEGLLETLAELSFPVNPRIDHNASVARISPGGRREIHSSTIVEFPAYAGRLAEIRSLLARRGLAPESVGARNMLEQIRGQDYNTNW
jgi:hypothetical protein